MTTAAQTEIKPGKLLINGEWTDASAGKTFKTQNPATGETLTEIAEADAKDVDRAVAAAREAFAEKSKWRTMSSSERGRLIWKLADLMEQHVDELAMLETL